MRTIYGDVEFTGVLAQKLELWENPEWKLPALYEALGVDSHQEAAVALARLIVPGFKPKSLRRRPGRPNLLSKILDATDSNMRDVLTNIILANYEERLFKRMEAILDEAMKKGRPMKVLGAAARLISEEELDGHWNPFHVEPSVARGKRETLAQSVAYLFTHRAGRRKQHEAIRRPFVESARREVEERLKPHRAEIYEELRQRMIKESEERRAAGGDLEQIIADIPNRMLVVAMEITDRYF